MSEFHRMITYLYLYEGNNKTRNIGFAKIEKRDQQCLIEIHMKSTGYSQENLPVYFYTRKGTQFPGILLGHLSLIRGSGDFKAVLDSENLNASGFCLSDIKGLFLPLSNQIMFLSQWDDDVFIRSAFLEYGDADLSKTSETESKSIPLPPKQPDTNESPVPEDGPDLQAAEAAPALESFHESDTGHSPDLENTDKNCWEQKWQFLMENFPVMTPFESDSDVIGIRLELKDLRQLPQKFWYLGNNSFLLHGFFNYRHLLLGIKKDSKKPQWFLGIPGVFQNPERVMAALFGFPEFKGQKDTENKNGSFGYWLRLLDL